MGRSKHPPWRWLLCLAIAYLTFEAWSQFRFQKHNIYMPMGIRANMGVDFYEAFKLRTHFNGKSPSGDLFITDEHGFRVAPAPTNLKTNLPTLLFGGDSRLFSYGLPWEQGFIASLQKVYPGHLHLQAHPGGSPAIFNHEMWTLKTFDQISPAPKVIIYDYDPLDGFGDIALKNQWAKPEWKKNLTRLKLALGGYGIQRLQSVGRTFIKQWKEPWPNGWQSLFPSQHKTLAPVSPPKPLLFITPNITSQPSPHTPPAPPRPKPPLQDNWKPNKPSQPQWKHHRSFPIVKEELIIMRDASLKRGVRLIILYQPRLVELGSRDSKMRDELEAICQSLQIEFLETFTAIDTSLYSHKSTLEDWFESPEEGIHYSSKGLAFTAHMIQRYLGKTQP